MEPDAAAGRIMIRPPLGRFLGEWLAVLLVVVALYASLASDVAASWGLVFMFTLLVPLEYRLQSIALTPLGLGLRTAVLGAKRELPWPLVQAITLGHGPFRSITLDRVDPRPATAHAERYRLRFGRGSLLMRRSQEAVRTQIERWWLTYRDAELPPGQEPLRFPPDVNPYAPPVHD